MRAQKKYTLAVLLAGLCWSIATDIAHSGSSTALQHAAMREACTKQGGRFELSWMYNDRGVQWGKVMSCSTSIGYIRCQGDLCRANRWVAREGALVEENGRAMDRSAMRFPAEPAAFSDALATLTDSRN